MAEPDLKFKPRAQRVRCVFTDEPQRSYPEHKGKVFAVIGPFDDFTDKAALQDALVLLLRGFNLEENPKA